MVAKVPAPTTPDDVERLSIANPGWQIEREADGTISMSPTFSDSGRRNLRLSFLVETWNQFVNAGMTFDSTIATRRLRPVRSRSQFWNE